MCRGFCKVLYAYRPIYSSPNLCETGTIIGPTVQLRILRPKEMKPLGEGCGAKGWQWQESDSGLSDSEFS